MSGLARLNADGSLDAGSGFDGQVLTIRAAGSGTREVYVGGRFRGYDGRTTGPLVRLNPDGTID